MQYSEAKIGRIFVVRLNDKEAVPDIIESFAFKKNVGSAICFMIGGVRGNSQVITGPGDDNKLPIEPIVSILKGVHEICGIGTIFVNEKNEPKLHMHASFGRDEKTLTGCTRKGIKIWRIGEVIIFELKNTKTKRIMDKDVGFEFMQTY